MSIKSRMNFVQIGARASGKTIYVTCLVKKTNGKIIIKDPDTKQTKSYIDEQWKYLVPKGNQEILCEVPASPGMFKILKLQYQNDEFGRVDFSIDDYDGNFTETITVSTDKSEETLKNEISSLKVRLKEGEHSDAEKKSLLDKLSMLENELSAVGTREAREKLLQSIHNKPNGIFFFLPYEEDTTRFQYFVNEISKFIELAEFPEKTKSPIPASIVITKWDDNKNDFKTKDEKIRAREYIENSQHLRDALHIIENFFEYVDVIPISSCKGYNLTAPLDYSLDKTFLQWYSTAQKLKEDKQHKKLLVYLSNRYEMMKFNQKYDFKALYVDVQKEFIDTIERELNALERVEEKDKYLNGSKEDESDFGINEFYLDKDLLEPFQRIIEKEKKRLLWKKRRKGFYALISTVGLLFLGIEVKNKIEVDETYGSIVNKNHSGAHYNDIKNDVASFLSRYSTADTFWYLLSDIPNKRALILDIKDKLLIDCKQESEEKRISILEDNSLTVDERRQKIQALKMSTCIDTSIIQQDEDQLTLQLHAQKWKKTVKGCLQNCTEVSDIDKLLNQANDKEKIVWDKEVKKLISSLNDKKYLLHSQSKLESLLTDIEKADSLEGLQSIIAKDGDLLAEDSVRKSLVAAISTQHKDKLLGAKEKKWLKTIETSLDQNVTITTLTELQNHISKNTILSVLITMIKEQESKEELKSIDYSNYEQLTEAQKGMVEAKITGKINEFAKDKLEDKPDEFDTDTMDSWINNMLSFNNFEIKQLNYTYTLPDGFPNILDKAKEENNIIKYILENGLDGISVTVIGQEGNSIEFDCDLQDQAITTKIGEQKLSYKEATNCEGDGYAKITYYKTITMKPSEHYNVSVEEYDRTTWNDVVSERDVDFSIEDLYYKLCRKESDGSPMFLSLDEEKIKLIFFKKKPCVK